jgi:hypothetical protein
MGDEWLVHTIVAMPVMANNGFIFDDDGAFSTHVNRRQDGVWTVSFRNPRRGRLPQDRALPQPLRGGARHYQPGAQRGRRALMDNEERKLTRSPLRRGAVPHP